MREPRIHTNQPLQPGDTVDLEPAAGRHLTQVLRLRPGAPLLLFNGDGNEFRARLQTAANGGAQAAVEQLERYEEEPPLGLHLCIGVSKGERMDFALQKAVELGATRISPMFTKRSVVRLQGERLQRRLTHWRKILVSACEQSGRCRLPQLDVPGDPEDPTGDTHNDLRLVLYHRAGTTLERLSAPQSGVQLMIGPEGGLEQEEVQQAQSLGFVPVRLGPRILRTETAPLAALAAIQMLWGDFRTR
jgi:16S rRNA (uracil1498-N3)-methyltransferase